MPRIIKGILFRWFGKVLGTGEMPGGRRTLVPAEDSSLVPTTHTVVHTILNSSSRGSDDLFDLLGYQAHTRPTGIHRDM